MKLPLLMLLAAVTLSIAGCSSGAPTDAAPTTITSPTVAPNPEGVIAFGHSGLTGEGTGQQYEAVKENSWATGTNPEVNSVYARLVAVRPENSGHVANTAEGGASSDSLVGQAESALQQVPYPQLAIISTIDNDIRCDGTDEEHIPELGAAVKDVLDLITTTSPETTILIVGQAGRPSVSFIQTLIGHDPSVMDAMRGTGPCDFFDPAGNLVEANFATLTGIIDGYEAEQARVCAMFPQCHTDGGVRAAYVDVLENFSPDWAHLNVRGQAAEAELIWPVVASALGL